MSGSNHQLLRLIDDYYWYRVIDDCVCVLTDLTWLPLLGAGRKSWYIIIVLLLRQVLGVLKRELSQHVQPRPLDVLALATVILDRGTAEQVGI